MRILVDANVIISYLLNPRQSSAIVKIFDAVFAGEVTVLFPQALLDEVAITVTGKARLRRRIPTDSLNVVISSLKVLAEAVPRIEEEIPQVTRDPKDDYLLAYAMVGEADYLVTGDKDLLVLENIDRLKIITPALFARLLS